MKQYNKKYCLDFYYKHHEEYKRKQREYKKLKCRENKKLSNNIKQWKIKQQYKKNDDLPNYLVNNMNFE